MKKMQKVFTAFSLCLAALVGSVMLSACNNSEGDGGNGEGNGGDTTTTYTITLPEDNDIYTISSDKTTAAENETVTLTVQLNNTVDYTLDSVKFNTRYCTKVNDTTYTFSMPASDVTISVSTTYYEEVLTDGRASFRDGTISQISKSSLRLYIYVDFTSELYINLPLTSSVKITSTNEDVIPASAVTCYSGSGDSYTNYLYFQIYSKDVNVGTCYLTFKITTTSNSTYTLVLKLEVVE